MARLHIALGGAVVFGNHLCEEGLVTGLSSHAGGVVIVDEEITKTNSIVRLKSGDYVTAYDLHQSEEMSK